jgi:hypothetical protein
LFSDELDDDESKEEEYKKIKKFDSILNQIPIIKDEERSLNPIANNLEFLKKRRERLRSAYPKDNKANDEGMVF